MDCKSLAQRDVDLSLTWVMSMPPFSPPTFYSTKDKRHKIKQSNILTDEDNEATSNTRICITNKDIEQTSRLKVNVIN